MPVLPETEIRKLFGQVQCMQQGSCPGTHKCGMWHPQDYVPDTVYHSRLRSNKGKNIDQQKADKTNKIVEEKNYTEPTLRQKDTEKPPVEIEITHHTWEQEESEQVTGVALENEEERKNKMIKRLRSSNEGKKKLENLVTIQEETEIEDIDFQNQKTTEASSEKENLNQEPVNLSLTQNEDDQQEEDVISVDEADKADEDEPISSTNSTPPTLEVLTPLGIEDHEETEKDEEFPQESVGIELDLEIVEETVESDVGDVSDGIELKIAEETSQSTTIDLNKHVENLEENNDTEKQRVIDEVKDSYPVTYFEKVKIRGDGLCMINSVTEIMKRKMVRVTADQLIDQLTNELRHNIGQYMEFTNGLDSDPIEEMENYKKYRKYNSALADLIIPLMSQTMKIRIVILHLDEEKATYNLVNRSMHIYSPEIFNETIFLEKEPDHYNSLIEKSGYRGEDHQTDEVHAQVDNNHESSSPPKIAPTTPTPPKTPPPTTQRSRRQLKLTDKMAACVESEKEKEKKKDPRNKQDKADTAKHKELKNSEVYCTCKRGDDGSKMVECHVCQIWYHTKCIGLTDAKLKELNTQKKNYSCQICCGKNVIINQYEKKLLEQKQLFESMKTTLNQRIGDKTEELKLLKRKEQQRKEGELLEKNRLKLKINKLVQEFKEKNVELAEQKKCLKDNEARMKSMETEKIPGAGNDKQLKKAKEEIKELKLSLQKMKKLLENEDEEDETKDDSNTNKEEELRKQLAKSKREIKRKELELDEVREEKNKLLQNNLDQKQTIRHLNNSLDLLTISAVNDEVSRAKSTKTKMDAEPKCQQNKGGEATAAEAEATAAETTATDKELDKLIEKLDEKKNRDDNDDRDDNARDRIPNDGTTSDEEHESSKNEKEMESKQGDRSKPGASRTRNSGQSKRNIICRYYQEGHCMFDDKCWYLHKAKAKALKQPTSQTFTKDRSIDDVHSSQRRDDSGTDNRKVNELDRSRKKQICKYYQQNRCNFGEDCWNVHKIEKKEERRERPKNDFRSRDNSKNDCNNNKYEKKEDRRDRSRSDFWQNDREEFKDEKMSKNEMVQTIKDYKRNEKNMKSKIHFLEKEIMKTRRT